MYQKIVSLLERFQKKESSLQLMADHLSINIPTLVGIINSSENDLICYSKDGLSISLKGK